MHCTKNLQSALLLVTLAQIPMPIKIGATFQNKLRPSPHLHPPLQVSTPGSRGKTLITQIYFRDHIPGGYEVELATNIREVSQCLESKNIFVDSCNNYTSFHCV